MKVNECMCSEVTCVKPGEKLNNVAKLMCNNHIGCVPVCDDNNCICGLVTDRDIILRAVACDKDVKNTTVSDIMTTNICTCTENDEITQAQNKMSNYQIRRLPVCDSNNHIVGILTLGDLANYNNEIGQKEVCNTIDNICNCNGQIKNAE